MAEHKLDRTYSAIEYFDLEKADPGTKYEYVDGMIYANVYPTDEIVMINPTTFAVEGRINMAGILDRSRYDKPMDVLNGIAYDETSRSIYVTGKLWPKLFEIELVKKQNL